MKTNLLKVLPFVLLFGLLTGLIGCGSAEAEAEPAAPANQGSQEFSEANASESSSAAPQNPSGAPSKE
jgi:ABC-type oligopeptide transport system substrate-binding subunit